MMNDRLIVERALLRDGDPAACSAFARMMKHRETVTANDDAEILRLRAEVDRLSAELADARARLPRRILDSGWDCLG